MSADPNITEWLAALLRCGAVDVLCVPAEIDIPRNDACFAGYEGGTSHRLWSRNGLQGIDALGSGPGPWHLDRRVDGCILDYILTEGSVTQRIYCEWCAEEDVDAKALRVRSLCRPGAELTVSSTSVRAPKAGAQEAHPSRPAPAVMMRAPAQAAPSTRVAPTQAAPSTRAAPAGAPAEYVARWPERGAAPRLCSWNRGRAGAAQAAALLQEIDADIVLLQESREPLGLEGYEEFVSPGDERGAGVSALWRRGTAAVPEEVVPGRVLALHVGDATLFNVYAPNTQFQRGAERAARRELCDAALWAAVGGAQRGGRGVAAAGDFNCCYAFGDHHSHARAVYDPARPPSAEAGRLIAGVRGAGLQDLGGALAPPGCPRWTYVAEAGGARYDYVFADPGLFQFYGVRPLGSDHSPVLAA